MTSLTIAIDTNDRLWLCLHAEEWIMMYVRLFAAAIILGSSTVCWTEEPAKKDDAREKEKLATEWLRYMEGEWKVEHKPLDESTKPPNDSDRYVRRVKATLVDAVLVVEEEHVSPTHQWNAWSVLYWDREHNELKEHLSLPPRVTELFRRKDGSSTQSLAENREQIHKAIRGIRAKEHYPIVLTKIEPEFVTGFGTDYSTMGQISYTKTTTGFVRTLDWGLYWHAMIGRSRDVYERVAEQDKKHGGKQTP